MGVNKRSDSDVGCALGFLCLLKSSLYPCIWRRQQDPSDLESKCSGLRGWVKGKSSLDSGLCCPVLCRLGRAGPASDSLKFDPAGWKPSFLSLGKHAWDPATIYHFIPGFSLSFYNWKMGTRHQGGVRLMYPLKLWISKALL